MRESNVEWNKNDSKEKRIKVNYSFVRIEDECWMGAVTDLAFRSFQLNVFLFSLCSPAKSVWVRACPTDLTGTCKHTLWLRDCVPLSRSWCSVWWHHVVCHLLLSALVSLFALCHKQNKCMWSSSPSSSKALEMRCTIVWGRRQRRQEKYCAQKATEHSFSAQSVFTCSFTLTKTEP